MNDKTKKLFMLLLDDSSDDDVKESSDSDEAEKLLVNFASECLNKEKLILERKLLTSLAESKIDNYTPQQFKQELGINKSLVLSLSLQLEQSKHFRNTDKAGRKPLSGKSNLFIFLWFISQQKASYRHVAKYFGVSLSTVHRTLFRVVNFLCDLSSEVIKWPEESERKTTSEIYLTRTGISGIVGTVGNKFINTGFCNKIMDSILIPVQAVCNEQNKFIDVFIGDANYIAENTLFENSNLVEKLYVLNEDECIAGNLDFPCLQNLITPANSSKGINFCLRQIEECLDNVKVKFKHLNCLKVKNSELKVLIIKSCFVLYNLDCDESPVHIVDNLILEHNYCG